VSAEQQRIVKLEGEVAELEGGDCGVAGVVEPELVELVDAALYGQRDGAGVTSGP
jgi:hypothetical protein